MATSSGRNPFVRGVGATAGESESDRDRRDAEHFGKDIYDRNGAASAGERRSGTENLGQHRDRFGQPGRVLREHRRVRAARVVLDVDSGSRRRVRFDVPGDELQNLSRPLIGHEPAGDLEMCSCRRDRLVPLAGEAAPDSVEVDGRPGPDQLLDAIAFFAGDLVMPASAMNFSSLL